MNFTKIHIGGLLKIAAFLIRSGRLLCSEGDQKKGHAGELLVVKK